MALFLTERSRHQTGAGNQGDPVGSPALAASTQALAEISHLSAFNLSASTYPQAFPDSELSFSQEMSTNTNLRSSCSLFGGFTTDIRGGTLVGGASTSSAPIAAVDIATASVRCDSIGAGSGVGASGAREALADEAARGRSFVGEVVGHAGRARRRPPSSLDTPRRRVMDVFDSPAHSMTPTASTASTAGSAFVSAGGSFDDSAIMSTPGSISGSIERGGNAHLVDDITGLSGCGRPRSRPGCSTSSNSPSTAAVSLVKPPQACPLASQPREAQEPRRQRRRGRRRKVDAGADRADDALGGGACDTNQSIGKSIVGAKVPSNSSASSAMLPCTARVREEDLLDMFVRHGSLEFNGNAAVVRAPSGSDSLVTTCGASVASHRLPSAIGATGVPTPQRGRRPHIQHISQGPRTPPPLWRQRCVDQIAAGSASSPIVVSSPLSRQRCPRSRGGDNCHARDALDVEILRKSRSFNQNPFATGNNTSPSPGTILLPSQPHTQANSTSSFACRSLRDPVWKELSSNGFSSSSGFIASGRSSTDGGLPSGATGVQQQGASTPASFAPGCSSMLSGMGRAICSTPRRHSTHDPM